MTDTDIEKAVIACKLMGPEFAARKEEITHELFAHAERIDELPDGYAFQFTAADPWPAKVLEFVETERQCCPFFTFEIIFEPNGGPLWLRLRGSEAIKAFIQTELAVSR